MSYPNRIPLVIVDGDPLVGRTLELMLRSAGYDARFLDGSFLGNATDPFQGVHLVLIGPRVSHDERESLLSRLRGGTPAGATIPVLELVAAGAVTRETVEAGALRVSWPCRPEQLKQKIEAALANGSRPR